MANLNNIVCISGGNTGKPDCGFNPKNVVMAFLTHKSKTFADADLAPASLEATLQAAIVASGKDRIYPVQPFAQFDDKSEEAKMATHGYGDKEFTGDGKYHWQFRILKGSVCYQKNLRKHNYRSDLRAIFVDREWNVFGTLTSEGELAGMKLSDFFADKVKLSNGSDPSIYTVDFVLTDPTELMDAPAFVKATFNVLDSCQGILDVTLTAGTLASGSIKVTAAKTIGGKSMYDDYADELAAAGAWVLTKAAAPVTISGVAKDAAIEGWTVTFTGTGVHKLTMADPATLASLGVGGAPDAYYESDILTVTVPS